jgi:hypothetical protein
MGSFKRPKPSYNFEELRIPDLASIGALASARELDWRTEVLKAALRRQLFMIASESLTKGRGFARNVRPTPQTRDSRRPD